MHGILGWGVASNLRLDTQAKGMAERLRSRTVVVPSHLVSSGPPAARWSSMRHLSDYAAAEVVNGVPPPE